MNNQNEDDEDINNFNLSNKSIIQNNLDNSTKILTESVYDNDKINRIQENAKLLMNHKNKNHQINLQDSINLKKTDIQNQYE